MARTGQKQTRQHRNAKGLLDPRFLSPDLVLTQPEVCLQLAMDLFHQPPSLIRANHLSGQQVGQVGHQDFRLLRADVRPGFTAFEI
jgi:hypothetical protein